MNTVFSAMRFLVFWIVLGLFFAGIILYSTGDLHIHLGSNSTTEAQTFTTGNPSANSFASAVKVASPPVVSIAARKVVKANLSEGEKLLDRFLGSRSPHRPKTRTTSTSGSGVILDQDGYILTNLHVIKGADQLEVTLTDGRSSIAQVVGTDPETDLAVLKIDLQNLPTAKLADVNDLRIGDITLAIGYPFTIGQTVTQGIVSATGRNRISGTPYQNFIQTDAAINPGNSGGALVNTDGELIGINSLIYSSTGNFQGISFAIPIDMASFVLNQIKKNGFVVRGWLGAEGQNVPSVLLEKIGLKDINGVLITGVEPDGPAETANIEEGDIITHINQRPILNITDIMTLVADSAPGDTLTLEGIRKRESFRAEVKLGQRPLRSQ